MYKVDLSNSEGVILKSYFKTTSLILIRLKSQALLMRDKGIKITTIASVLDRTPRSVGRWIKDWKKERLGSIFTGHMRNINASKLTKAQRLEIKHVLSQPPSDFGLPKEFWDVPQLKHYLWTHFGVVYESIRSYHFLLEFGNLSFKLPDKFDFKRNEKQITDRLEEIYKKVIPLLGDPSWEVFCSDETRILLTAITRRAWIKKGEKTVIKTKRTDDFQNYIGFLNQRTFKCHIFEIAWGKQEEIIKTTTEFLRLYPDKKICIVWDNATCHKGILMRQALSKGQPLERLHLISFPPYAPDKNPIEHVWSLAKDKLSNTQRTDFEKVKDKFMKLTNNQIFNYQM